MQSVVNSGLKQKVLEYYKREIIQTYGFEHLITITLLENAGLIKSQVPIFPIKFLFQIAFNNKKYSHRQVQDAMLSAVGF